MLPQLYSCAATREGREVSSNRQPRKPELLQGKGESTARPWDTIYSILRRKCG